MPSNRKASVDRHPKGTLASSPSIFGSRCYLLQSGPKFLQTVTADHAGADNRGSFQKTAGNQLSNFFFDQVGPIGVGQVGLGDHDNTGRQIE